MSKVNLICVGCGYEAKEDESQAGEVCPQCGNQVLNVKTKALSNWASKPGDSKKASKKK